MRWHENRGPKTELGKDSNRPDYSNIEHGRFVEGYTHNRNLDERKVVNVNPIVVVIQPIVQNVEFNAETYFYIQNITGLATVNDGDLLSTDTFDYPPAAGYYVYLNVNGIYTVPADGGPEASTSPFYFTDSTGLIIRPQGQFQIGDQMHWNGSVGGYEIDPTDYLILSYYTTTKPS